MVEPVPKPKGPATPLVYLVVTRFGVVLAGQREHTWIQFGPHLHAYGNKRVENTQILIFNDLPNK